MAKVIKGLAVAKKVRQGLREEILEIQKTHPDFVPGLTVVQVSFTYFNLRNSVKGSITIIDRRPPPNLVPYYY